jgi:hypothetical protein
VFLVFLTGSLNVYAQESKSDSLIKLAINTASQHSSDVNKLIFNVHSIEKARFSKFIGIGKKRLQNIEGISHIALSEEDVVRHKLVKAIIKAYDKEHEKEEEMYGKR